MDLFKRLGRQKKTRKKAPSRKRNTSRKRNRSGGLPWQLGAVAFVVVLGIGLLYWSGTRRGQATLLTMGSVKMFGEVQAAVDAALVAGLPGFVGGPATEPADYDWPAPTLGTGANIRCRSISVSSGQSWWEYQLRIAEIVESAGARVLWGERLLPGKLGAKQQRPNEELDLLRLDIGVKGRPTHTLVLSRADVAARVQWGAGPGLSRWTEFAAGDAPTVALVIDDWGHGKTAPAMSILALPTSLTLAVLPDLSYSRFFSLQRTDLVLPPGKEAGKLEADKAASSRAARLAAGCLVEVSTGRRQASWLKKRREIMLHMPMQPQSYPETNPGPNPLLVGMDRQEIEIRLDDAMASLMNVTGVNNHMGSAATSDTPTMRALMSVLEGRNLYFVDSLTSSKSVAHAEAQRAGIPTARNRIFLDYDNENETAIATNLERLVQSARAGGFALGIGHPHRATAAVLAREIPRLVQEGVRFVTVSELMALREFQEMMATGGGDG